MRKSILRKLLLLTPIVILGVTLLFVNLAVKTFNDTAYQFMYQTNMQTVDSFSSELSMLSSQGFTSSEHGTLYTNMIHNFNTAVGQKDAIVTFMVDEAGIFYHSSDYNRAYLENLLLNKANMNRISAAASSSLANGEITMDYGNASEKMYYHRFYSGQHDYKLFLCVERDGIDAQLNANGVIIPLCFVGLLLLFALEYIIWLKLLCVNCGACRMGSEPEASKPVVSKSAVSEPVVSEPVASEPAVSEPGGSEPIGD